MLAAINGYHLTSDSRRFEKKSKRGGNIFWIRTATQDSCCALLCKMALRLPPTTQSWPRTDPVYTDLRGQSLRRRLRQRP